MKIAIINTGGTISCIGSPLAPMPAGDFAAASNRIFDPILKQQFSDIDVTYLTDIVFSESSNALLDSTNLQPSDWCIVALSILNNYADYDGFVVLHGTDSLEFTSAALPFLLNNVDEFGNGIAVLDKPIIITGSQVPLYFQADSNAELTLNFNTDAYQNMCGAVASARTGIPEVCVYFQNALYRGSRVRKTNANKFNAFSSPNYPVLAEYGAELSLYSQNWLPGPVSDEVSLSNRRVLAAQRTFIEHISANIVDVPVAQLTAFPAHYSQTETTAYMADMISAIVSTGATGLILQAYGQGNFPSGNPNYAKKGAIFQALKSANESGVNIVDCTQVITGSVSHSAYASGAWLPCVGALSPADMTPTSAFAKLMILTSASRKNGWSRHQLRTLFQTSLVGEMTSVESLDSRTNSTLMPGQFISTLDGNVRLMNHHSYGPALFILGNEIPVWRLLSSLKPADLPGRLVMQNDGNLVFYSRTNTALWVSDTQSAAQASSKLVLSGTYNENTPVQGTLLLQVYNYSRGFPSAVLYQT